VSTNLLLASSHLALLESISQLSIVFDPKKIISCTFVYCLTQVQIYYVTVNYLSTRNFSGLFIRGKKRNALLHVALNL
jgi:hypothetical protein